MPRVIHPLTRMRDICLTLPDTKETLTWGKPHFRVGDKIFAGYGEEEGRPVVGFKLEMEHARETVKRPGFAPAPYVGHRGWVSMDLSRVKDWKEVEAFLKESYRLIAPRHSLAKLGATPAGKGRRRPDLGARPSGAQTRPRS